MKKMTLFILSLILSGTAYAETLILDNQTPYPNKNSTISIQWASSASDVKEGNDALLQGKELNQNSLQPITQPGKITLTYPQKAECFRVLVWSNGESEPHLHTNWVEITPNKTYPLKTDQLVPTVLMPGMGC